MLSKGSQDEARRAIVSSPEFGFRAQERAPSPRFGAEQVESPPPDATNWRQTQERDNELLGVCERHFGADNLKITESAVFTPLDLEHNYCKLVGLPPVENSVQTAADCLLPGGVPHKWVFEVHLDTVMLVSSVKWRPLGGHHLSSFPFELMKVESLENSYLLSGEEDATPHLLPIVPMRIRKETELACAGVARKLRLTFLGARRKQEQGPYEADELDALDQEVAMISRTAAPSVTESERAGEQRNLRKALERVTIQGLECQRVPAAGNVIALFNLAYVFKDVGQSAEAVETDMLVGMALMNSRRYVQACEVFRKIEGELLDRLGGLEEDSLCLGGTSHAASSALSSFLTKAALLKNKQSSWILTTCAKLEILIAECMNAHSQLSEKLEALKRAFHFISGQPPKGSPKFATSNHYYQEDAPTALLKLAPLLIPFLLTRVKDPNESVRVAILRCLEFFLETLGASLQAHIPNILRALVSTFPNASPTLVGVLAVQITLNQATQGTLASVAGEQAQREHPEFLSFLTGVYSHLFQTLLSTANSAATGVLSRLFEEVVLPLTHAVRNCVAGQPPQMLLTYLFRLSRKILSYCSLPVPVAYLNDLVGLMAAAGLTSSAKILTQSLPSTPPQQALLHLWSTVRLKHLLTLNNPKEMCEWLAEELPLSLVEMELHSSQFYYYLEVAVLLSKRPSTPLLPVYAQYKQATAQMFALPPEDPAHAAQSTTTTLLDISQRFEELERTSAACSVSLDFLPLVEPLKQALDEAKRSNNFTAFQLSWVTFAQIFERLPREAGGVLLGVAQGYMEEIRRHLESSGSASVQTLKVLLQILPSVAQMLLRMAGENKHFMDFLRRFYLSFVQSIPGNVADEVFLVLGLLLETLAGLERKQCRAVLRLGQKRLFLNGRPVSDRGVHSELVLQAMREKRVFTKELIQATVRALTDKFTAKSGQQKEAQKLFLKVVLASYQASTLAAAAATPPMPKRRPSMPRNDERVSPDGQLEQTLDLDFQSQELGAAGGDWESEASLRAAFDPDFFSREVGERTLLRFKDLLETAFLENEFAQLQKQQPRMEPRKIIIDQRKSVANAFLRNVEQRTSEMRVRPGDKKQQLQTHEQEQDRLEFFLTALRQLTEQHLPLLQHLLYLREFRIACLRLLESGHLSLRLKAFEIAQILCDFPLKTAPGEPSRDQLALSQFSISLVSHSFQRNPGDSFLQFQRLSLLLRVFKDILAPAPPQQPYASGNLLAREEPAEAVDLEALDLMTDAPLITGKLYQGLRAQTLVKIWPLLSEKGVLSSWANMRSLTYTLLNVAFKLNLRMLADPLKDRVLGLAVPLLTSLLESGESDSNAGGLNILGALCGLQSTQPEGDGLMRDFFRINAGLLPDSIWARVFMLSKDPDLTLREAAELLVQLSAPRDLISRLHREKIANQKEQIERALGRLIMPKLDSPKGERSEKWVGEFEQLMLQEPDYSLHAGPGLEGYELGSMDEGRAGQYEYFVDALGEDQLRAKL